MMARESPACFAVAARNLGLFHEDVDPCDLTTLYKISRPRVRRACTESYPASRIPGVTYEHRGSEVV